MSTENAARLLIRCRPHRHERPRPTASLDVAAVRRFMQSYAADHGTGGTKHARAMLSRAMTIAVETSSLRTSFNPVLLARNAIPAVRVRNTGLDHRRAPTDAGVEALPSGLRSYPEA